MRHLLPLLILISACAADDPDVEVEDDPACECVTNECVAERVEELFGCPAVCVVFVCNDGRSLHGCSCSADQPPVEDEAEHPGNRDRY